MLYGMAWRIPIVLCTSGAICEIIAFVGLMSVLLHIFTQYFNVLLMALIGLVRVLHFRVIIHLGSQWRNHKVGACTRLHGFAGKSVEIVNNDRRIALLFLLFL